MKTSVLTVLFILATLVPSHAFANQLVVNISDTTFCSMQDQDVPLPAFPVVQNRFVPIDVDGNSKINEIDINAAIVLANASYEDSNKIRRGIVDLSSLSAIVIDNPVKLLSGVFLYSTTSTALSSSRTNFSEDHIITTELNTAWAGVIGLHLRFNPSENVISRGSLIRLNKGSQRIYLANNLFVSENGTTERDLESGTATAGIDLDDSNSYIYIDSNRFQHVPFGVRSKDKSVSFIYIQRNIFSEWREKAIFLSADYVDKTLRGSSNDGIDNPAEYYPENVFIRQNRINSPKAAKAPRHGGSSKQPINVTSSNVLAMGVPRATPRNIIVNYNYVSGSGVPHIPEEVTTGSADMISVHQTDSFRIARNCVMNSGELGINASYGSKNGHINNNLVVGADMPCINIGIAAQPEEATKIQIYDNILRDCGMDRNDDFDVNHYSHSGITIISANTISIRNNTITDSALSSLDPEMAYGIFLYKVSGGIFIGSDNDFRLHPLAIEISKDRIPGKEI